MDYMQRAQEEPSNFPKVRGPTQGPLDANTAPASSPLGFPPPRCCSHHYSLRSPIEQNRITTAMVEERLRYVTAHRGCHTRTPHSRPLRNQMAASRPPPTFVRRFLQQPENHVRYDLAYYHVLAYGKKSGPLQGAASTYRSQVL